MKKVFSFLIACLLIVSAEAQTGKTHYTVSGGPLGHFNFSSFKLTGTNTANIDYNMHTSAGFGFWVNFPISRTFSIEPQLAYDVHRIKSQDQSSPLLLNDGSLKYFSLPILFKLGMGKNFAFNFGPQFDFFSSVEDRLNNAKKEDFNKMSFALTAGLELFPHGRVGIFSRYAWGLNNVDNTGNPNTTNKYKNLNLSAGVKIRLFGHKVTEAGKVAGATETTPAPKPTAKAVVAEKKAAFKEKDTDGDGILDKDDKCPTVPGIAKYQGCPIPDTDGDGINDEEDVCVDIPGLSDNFGCPELILYYKNDVSAPDNFDLDELKKVNEYYNKHKSLFQSKELSLVLNGHASTPGTSAHNQKLSEDRANHAKEVLVKDGIPANRIITKGYGEQFPIGDQKTAEGKAKSRRVVVRLVKM